MKLPAYLKVIKTDENINNNLFELTIDINYKHPSFLLECFKITIDTMKQYKIAFWQYPFVLIYSSIKIYISTGWLNKMKDRD